MIDVKEAMKIAKDYVMQCYDPNEIPNFLLEEVEFDYEEKYWLVTFGFRRSLSYETSGGRSFSYVFPGTKTPIEDRAYKTVKVDAEKV